MNVLVVGGSRGIGAASARRFAALGWDVAIGWSSEAQRAQELASAVAERGQRAITVRADVSHEREVVEMFDEVDDRLGPLDALVNSAGIVAAPSRVEDMDVGRLERMMAVNVVGSFLCAREAVRRMSVRHGGAGGAIVNVSSGAARIGSPGEFVDYAASKSAVETMTIGLAREVGGDGIRVNAVRPGIIATEIHARNSQPDKPARLASTVPVGRAGSAEEVAAAIVWLCGPDASYVSGAILDVAGGR
jgi:NAD(P)-dependent dehydrogenase (short-subunit alcohol dehydrogenase family)